MQLCTCEKVRPGALKSAAWQLAVIHAAQPVPAEVCSTSVLHGLCSLCCGPTMQSTSRQAQSSATLDLLPGVTPACTYGCMLLQVPGRVQLCRNVHKSLQVTCPDILHRGARHAIDNEGDECVNTSLCMSQQLRFPSLDAGIWLMALHLARPWAILVHNLNYALLAEAPTSTCPMPC